MYYSTIGLIAIVVLLLVNYDILLNRADTFRTEAWTIYRRFLYAMLIYYVSDVLWGILEEQKLAVPLFIDTTFYFVAMALGVLFWAEYTVAYLEDKTAFGRFFVVAGRVIAGAISALALANTFVPVLFTVDGNCVYRALPLRYAVLISQILLLLLISSHAIRSIIRRREDEKQKYQALASFGIIMAVFLFIQLWFPYLPLYSIAYMLGTCLLHTFVINEEKEDFRRRLQEAYDREKSLSTVFAHIALSLARGYTDLFYVNMDTDEYIEYEADDESGALTELRRGSDFFESCKQEVELFVHEDDHDLFVNAMDRQFLTKALDRTGMFQMIYRRIKGGDPFYVRMKVTRMADDPSFIVIGVTDIDEQMKQRRAEEMMREERVIYNRIQALSGNFIVIYMVENETGRYREFGASDDFSESLRQAKSGENFFETVREAARIHNFPEDVDRFLSVFTKEQVMAEIERSGIFVITFRMMMNGEPIYVQLKAALVEEEERQRLIVGINDIDAQVRQEMEYGLRLAQAQKQASIDALTGVKNKHAFLEEENRLDRQIARHSHPPFAIVMLDVNDLKKINDTAGHQTGDQYIRDACSLICETFKHSPVFRIGGDEFAVISKGTDYEHIEELVGKIRDHNIAASRTGGVVVACGMACFGDDDCVASVFERADHNMYEDKNELKEKREAVPPLTSD